MNSRIRELQELAFSKCKTHEDNLIKTDDAFEKFAELILQDVEDILDNLYHLLPLEQAAILLTLDEQIKSHFYEFYEFDNQDNVESRCPTCNQIDGGTSCGLPNCGLIYST